MAVTADGKIDTVERRGARISGPADSARVSRLRAAADAVLVGGRTLLREDPRLTIRDEALIAERRDAGRAEQPLKIAIVSHIGSPGGEDALPTNSRFLNEGGGKVLVCTTIRTDRGTIAWLEDQGAQVMIHGSGRVDLVEMASGLATMGVEQLMVEGGSTIVAAFLAAGLVDELQLAVAPIIFGGETAPSPVGGDGFSKDDAVRLSLTDATTSDDGDVVLRYLVGTA